MSIKARCLGLKPLNQVLFYLTWGIYCRLWSPLFSENTINTAQCDHPIEYPCSVWISRWNTATGYIKSDSASIQCKEWSICEGFPLCLPRWGGSRCDALCMPKWGGTLCNALSQRWRVSLCTALCVPRWEGSLDLKHGGKINKFHSCDI